LGHSVDSLADLPLDAAIQVDETCDRFESAYRSGTRPRIEAFVDESPELVRKVLFLELVKLELQLRLMNDSDTTFIGADYRARFPEFQELLDAVLGALSPPVELAPAHLAERRSAPSSNPRAAQSPAARSPRHRPAANSTPELVPFAQMGSYRLESRIGQGGMGTVYLALHQALDRRVALKVMQRERMLKPEAVARFQREMKAVARLHHRNIVMAYDAGEVNGMHFLAMEHVSGWDLASICRCFETLPIPVACECIRQAAQGLQHVHEHGFVHRDIKPSNLMLTRDGDVKLLDLGLARLRDDDQDERLTNDASPMGTIEYMAPEQARNPHGVDIRADLYSLGCTLFKLICGHSPFARPARNTVQLLSAHLETPPPSIRNCRDAVPNGLADLMEWLLRKDPADRPQTPAEVVKALKPFASERILKSFACAVTEISDARGQLPDRAPVSLGADTERWKETPEEDEPEFATPTPDIVTPIPSQPPTLPRPDSAPVSFGTRRSWLIGLLTCVGLVAGLFVFLRQEQYDAVVGIWKTERGAVTSPAAMPGVLQLKWLSSSDYELDLTVTSISGSAQWTIVSNAQPQFSINFRPMVIMQNVSQPRDDVPTAPNWEGEWGDYTDKSQRRFHLSVRNHRLRLERDGVMVLDEQLPPDAAQSFPLPETTRLRPGIYLLTHESSLRFSGVQFKEF
jgi:serine/threonine protein kinase